MITMYKYRFADGSPCPYPTSYNHACEVKSRLYDDGQRCQKCNSAHSIKYTKTQECVSCSRLKAINLIHLQKGFKQYIWTDEDGKHWGEPQAGRVTEIPQEEWDEMLGLIQLVDGDQDFTITDKPCRTHGHYGVKRLGKCYECHQKRTQLTPRQEALHNGVTWYTPETPCLKCGNKALRNVHNGACQGCTPPKKSNNDSAATMLMQLAPDMVVTRSEAVEQGFTVYRTGKECSKGHTGWRYVSTGNCIDCRKSGV